jgi:CNT family concentrative nucleoside transporter
VHGYLAWFPASLESVLGWLLAPVAWLIGIPWKDASHIGSLLGIRMVGNELIAYGQLGALKPQLDARSFTIATYALCGFANLSSIGIQIGGMGTMANLISAAIVGIMT